MATRNKSNQNNLIIRNANTVDVAAILEIYNDAILNTTSVYSYEAKTLQERMDWLLAKQKDGQPVLVAEHTGSVHGFASYGPFRPWPAYKFTVEHSIYVHPKHRGCGIGSKLLQSLMETTQKNGIHTMIGGIDAGNEISIRLHERFGFIKVGELKQVGYKFDRWLDLVFMQKVVG